MFLGGTASGAATSGSGGGWFEAIASLFGYQTEEQKERERKEAVRRARKQRSRSADALRPRSSTRANNASGASASTSRLPTTAASAATMALDLNMGPSGSANTSSRPRPGHRRSQSLDVPEPEELLTGPLFRERLLAAICASDLLKTSDLLSRAPALLTRETIMGDAMMTRCASVAVFQALNTNVVPEIDGSPLVTAVCRNTSPEVLDQVVSVCVLNRWVIPSSGGGMTLLHYACDRDMPHASVVERLLLLMNRFQRVFVNVGLNDVDVADGCTSLMKAARRGHAGVLRVLIQFGTRVGTADPIEFHDEDPQTGLTALGLAIFSPRTSSDLRCADPFVRAQGMRCYNRRSVLTGRSILSELVLADNPVLEDKVSSLIALGADPNLVSRAPGSAASAKIKDTRGWAPLHFAAESGNATIVAALIQAGAGVNYPVICDPPNREAELTPLAIAAQNGHDLVVGYLLSRGARVDEAMLKNCHESCRESLTQALKLADSLVG